MTEEPKRQDVTRPVDGGSESDDSRLAGVLAEYLDRVTAGEALDEDEIRRAHPDLAVELIGHLRNLQQIEARPDGAPPGDTGSAKPLGTLGDFTLRRKIGSGGMGVVYEAWQTSMDRRVALKVLPAALAGDSATFTRFLREARTAGKLHHPNIVSVHALGLHESTPYYAMELVEGETLAQLLARSAGASGNDSVEEKKPDARRPRSSRRHRDDAEDDTRRRLSPIVGLFRKPESGRRSRRQLAGEGDAGPAASLEPGLDGGSPGRAAGPVSEAPESTPAPGAALEARDMPRETDEITAIYSYHVAQAFAEVADGLQHAHERGITHRDIKPSNLILDREGRLRILDFGLAHLEGQESLTRSGDLVGTVLYMSPEQAMARRIPVDHRTDIYSLGATLYEMLTWSPPFRGKDYRDTLSQIVLKDPQPLRKLNPRIPRDLETIVLKCLRKDPSDRYATAEALAQDLGRFVRGDPVEARPMPLWEKAVRRAWRSRGKLGAACLIVLLVLTSGLLLYNHRRGVQEARLAVYRDKVLGAIGKMELRKRAGHGQAPSRSTALEPTDVMTRDPARDSGGVAHAAGLECARSFPDPAEEARAQLEEAARLFPARPETYYHLAQALDLLGRKQESKAAVARALERDPRFAPALLLRESASGKSEDQVAADVAKALAAAEGAPGGSSGAEGSQLAAEWLASYESHARGQKEKNAVEDTELVESFSADTEPYLGYHLETRLQVGRSRMEAGDLDGALESFATARALWPELAEPLLLLGEVFIVKGDAARAEERFAVFHARTERRDAFALAAAWLYHEHKDYLRGLAWTEKAKGVYSSDLSRVEFLFHLDRAEEAIETAKGIIRAYPDDAWARWSLAIGLHGQGKLEDAAEEFRRAIDLEPKEGSFHHGLASNLMVQEKLEEALAAYEKALSLDPGNAKIYSDLGIALERAGSENGSLEARRKAIELDPKNPQFRWYLAMLFRDRGRIGEAVGEYRKALELDPRNPEIRVDYALVLDRQGKPDEAIGELRAAVELDKKSPKSHKTFALVLRSQGRLDEAIGEYRKALDLDPLDARTHASLAKALNDGGKLDEAVREFFKAVELDRRNGKTRIDLVRALRHGGKLEARGAEVTSGPPLAPYLSGLHEKLGKAIFDLARSSRGAASPFQGPPGEARDAKALCERGARLAKQGKLYEALQAYRRAAELAPQDHDADVHGRPGAALLSLGKPEEAVLELRRAADLEPARAAIRRDLGLLLLGLGRLEEAEPSLRKAVELDPEDAAARLLLGTALLELGKPGEAALEYRKATELAPMDPCAHQLLGCALYVRGASDEALRSFEKAREIDPEDAWIHWLLGTTLYDRGDREGSVACFRKAAELEPSDPSPCHGMGWGLLMQGRLGEAARAYRMAVDRDQASVPARVALARVLEEQGRLFEAFSQHRRALELGSTDPDGMDMLTEILRTRRKLDLNDELRLLIPILEARSKPGADPDATCLKVLALALAYDSPSRDPKKAVGYARRAVEKAGDSSPDELAFLSDIQWKSGEREEAVRTMEKAVKLPEANAHHSQVLSELRAGLLPVLASNESVDAALELPAVEVLVPGGAEWRFFRGRSEPSADLEWTRLEFDDSSWEKGLSGFGTDYGRFRNRDMGTYLGNMQDRDAGHTTLYARRRFAARDPGLFRQLRLAVYADDGFVAYLNGKEVARGNAGPLLERIPFDGLPRSGGPPGAPDGRVPVEVRLDAKDLRAGENCLAVQGVNRKLPELPPGFYLEPIFEAERAPDPERPRKLLEACRAAAKDEAARARVAYMEGRIGAQGSSERKEGAE